MNWPNKLKARGENSGAAEIVENHLRTMRVPGIDMGTISKITRSLREARPNETVMSGQILKKGE